MLVKLFEKKEKEEREFTLYIRRMKYQGEMVISFKNYKEC